MDTIHQRFPQYDEGGQALIDKAYAIASAALADETRGNGHPFIEHPVNVALIAADEIGLPADCVAAVFLHEATRKHPEIDLHSGGFPEDVYKMVEGLNKIATIKPKDTRLEAESYIDEARYARAFVNDKFRFDHWGRIKIRYALRQKGVSDFDTDDALALIDDDDYRQALADFIASRRRTTKGDTPYAVNQKIARAAITRGFEPQMVFDALSVE